MSLPAVIPLRREPEAEGLSPGGSMVGVAVLFVLVLLVVAAWLKRAWNTSGRSELPSRTTGWRGIFQRNGDTSLTVSSSTRLTPRHSLHEVHWQGRRLLIGCSEQATQVLGDVPLTAKPEDGERDASSVREIAS